MAQSAGMLVNCIYGPRAIATNHEDFVINCNIAAALVVRRLARNRGG